MDYTLSSKAVEAEGNFTIPAKAPMIFHLPLWGPGNEVGERDHYISGGQKSCVKDGFKGRKRDVVITHNNIIT